eukprot:Skav202128  [mRNA]  locus=scaffold1980:263824:264588:+ [translate_table: standard]
MGWYSSAWQDWYSSFVLEKDLAIDFVSSVGADLPPPLRGWQETGTVWSFFGSNSAPASMAGKPEHVDELRPGVVTMHSQIRGRKLWRLRPNAFADWGEVPILSVERVAICCEEGDQLLLDTAAWYHATSIPGGTGFTWSIAQDLIHEDDANGIEVMESIQLRVSHELCQLCLTPTAPPPGSPPGTCGCWCCGQERLKLVLWRSFRLSSLLTQKFLRTLLPWSKYLTSMSRRSRLAICDRKTSWVLLISLRSWSA